MQTLASSGTSLSCGTGSALPSTHSSTWQSPLCWPVGDGTSSIASFTHAPAPQKSYVHGFSS